MDNKLIEARASAWDAYAGRPIEFTISEAFNVGFEAGTGYSAANEWVQPEAFRGTGLRWLLMLDRHDREGIRLGLPEDGGWRVVDERGKSTWLPPSVKIVGMMELFVPVDVPLPAPYQSKGEGASESVDLRLCACLHVALVHGIEPPYECNGVACDCLAFKEK